MDQPKLQLADYSLREGAELYSQSERSVALLKEENERLKQELIKLKEEIDELKDEIEQLESF